MLCIVMACYVLPGGDETKNQAARVSSAEPSVLSCSGHRRQVCPQVPPWLSEMRLSVAEHLAAFIAGCILRPQAPISCRSPKAGGKDPYSCKSVPTYRNKKQVGQDQYPTICNVRCWLPLRLGEAEASPRRASNQSLLT